MCVYAQALARCQDELFADVVTGRLLRCNKKRCTLLGRGRLASERPARFYGVSKIFSGICATNFFVACVNTFSLDAARKSVTKVDAHVINDLVEVLPH
jgi:hypothetical protein